MKLKLVLLCFGLLIFTVSFAQDDEIKDEKIPAEKSDTLIIDDVDLEDIEEDELAKESSFPWKKFAVGGQIGNLQFGNTTRLAIFPEMNYQLADGLQIGLGGVYDYTRFKRVFNGFQFLNVNYKARNIGGRSFLRYTPSETLPVFIQTEYEFQSQETPYTSEPQNGVLVYKNIEQNVNNFNTGLGFYNGPYYLSLLYNFSHRKNQDDYFDKITEAGYQVPTDKNTRNRYYPYTAVSFRGGLNIPLGQGNGKNKKKKNKKRKEKQQ